MRDLDRTVHARSAGGHELVRYDRAGRWYTEYVVEDRIILAKHRVETVKAAVEMALDWESLGGTIFLDKPGGHQFDAKVRGAKAKMARHR